MFEKKVPDRLRKAQSLLRPILPVIGAPRRDLNNQRATFGGVGIFVHMDEVRGDVPVELFRALRDFALENGDVQGSVHPQNLARGAPNVKEDIRSTVSKAKADDQPEAALQHLHLPSRPILASIRA